jgi:CRISPR-associated protein Csm2
MERKNQKFDSHRSNQQKWKNQFNSTWITDEIDEAAIDYADKFGKELKNQKLTTSQIRNVFGEMKRIQLKGIENEKTAFLLLRPKIAYAAERNRPVGFFKNDFFELAIKHVQPDTENAEKRYNNLMNLMEAILAYHKTYGGK